MPIADLEWLVMPAILLKQFRIFYQGEQPVGVALWAMVDDAVAKRIDAGEKRLAPAEWKCGEQKRIVETVAPFWGRAADEKLATAQRPAVPQITQGVAQRAVCHPLVKCRQSSDEF